MQDDIAKAVIAKNGAPLTIQEHESLVSEIKKNTAQAHDEMLECKKMVPIGINVFIINLNIISEILL